LTGKSGFQYLSSNHQADDNDSEQEASWKVTCKRKTMSKPTTVYRHDEWSRISGFPFWPNSLARTMGRTRCWRYSATISAARSRRTTVRSVVLPAYTKGRTHPVWITFGAAATDHLTHGIHEVSTIYVVPPLGQSRAVLEVEANDGTRTVLQLNTPEEYALAPASNSATGELGGIAFNYANV
jgi:hypothetical protein